MPDRADTLAREAVGLECEYGEREYGSCIDGRMQPPWRCDNCDAVAVVAAAMRRYGEEMVNDYCASVVASIRPRKQP